MTIWTVLCLPSDDSPAVADALRAATAALGYTAFDPFGLLPGKSYPKAVRAFVAPSLGGWTRVIVGDSDEALAREVSALLSPVLFASLDGGTAQIGVYADGQESGVEALVPYLRPGCTPDTLKKLLSTPDLQVVNDSGEDTLPLDTLPGDVQAMAGGVNLKAAQSMFAKMTGTAMKRAGQEDADADAARKLIAAASPADWSSAGGQRIGALLGCLTIPGGWQTPEFIALRDAYQLHNRKRRNPNATNYPGDAEAMAAVPDALDYTPVYAGKDA